VEVLAGDSEGIEILREDNCRPSPEEPIGGKGEPNWREGEPIGRKHARVHIMSTLAFKYAWEVEIEIEIEPIGGSTCPSAPCALPETNERPTKTQASLIK
jgi:hypothetical protein